MTTSDAPLRPTAAVLRPMNRASVIGGGTMGRSIAMCLGDAHMPLALPETGSAKLDAATASTSIAAAYDDQVRRGRINVRQTAECLSRITSPLDDLPLVGAEGDMGQVAAA